MTWSPHDVETKIEGALERLEELLDDLSTRAHAAAEAKVAHELAYNLAFVKARRTPVDGRRRSEAESKAEAVTQTAEQYAARVRCEEEHDTIKRVLGVVMAQCDLLRTLAASRRAAP